MAFFSAHIPIRDMWTGRSIKVGEKFPPSFRKTSIYRQQSDNFSYELYVLKVSQEGVSPLSITSSYFIISLVRLPGHSANFKADVLVTGDTFAKLASVW